MNLKKTSLENGLKIITVPQKNTLAATVLVLVGTGSKYEKKKTNGISHLLEHLLFKGTKKRPNQISIAEPLDRVGGMYNAFTGEEYTGYYAKVDSRHLDLALDVISDIYLNSKIDPKEIKKEKSVIYEEINMYYDHPSYYVQNLWTKLLYGDQPAGWDIAGTKEGLSKISRKEIISYMKSQYVSSNTIVCISGNIPEAKKIESKVKKHFSKISEEKFFEKPKVIEKQTNPQCLINERKTDQTHFCLGVRGYSLSHKNRYSQDILATILGGMMSSRLFIEVREKLGLAYYVRTESYADTDTGYLMTKAGVRNDKIEKSISVILREYKKISQREVPSRELKKSKDHIKGKMALMLEASDSQASFYGLQELLQKEILTPKQICDRIDKVTKRDLLLTAREIFKPSKLNLALLGPFKNNKKFLNLLKYGR